MLHEFESDQHKDFFLAALERHLVPLKFAFSGTAAITHDRLGRHASYHDVVGSTALAVSSLKTALSPLDTATPRHLVEIGPGNGIHSNVFLGSLAEADVLIKDWTGLDFSSELLKIAQQRVQAGHPQLSTAGYTWDIESGPYAGDPLHWSKDGYPVVVAMLGHTLGNVLDPTSVLRHIRSSFAEAELFLLGVTLYTPTDSPSAYIEPYLNDVFVAAVLQPFRMAGFDLNQGHLEMSFSVERRAVVGAFILDHDYTFGASASTSIRFAAGTRIECFMSRRFLTSDIDLLLTDTGWQVCARTFDTTATHVVLAATPNHG